MRNKHFFESGTDGAPLSRTFRPVVRQSTEGPGDTAPSGTDQNRMPRHDELHEHADVGCPEAPCPERFARQMTESHAESFVPRDYLARHGAWIRELDVAASA